MSNEGHRGVSLHAKILIALIAGATLGSLVNVFTGGKETPWLEILITYVFNPIGQVFLAMLFMTVISLVFSSLALGVAQLGGGKDLGRIGLKNAIIQFGSLCPVEYPLDATGVRLRVRQT